ncbi:MAG: type II CAAX endopeptidase family protein [Candidatus Acidiferrales bacterium]
MASTESVPLPQPPEQAPPGHIPAVAPVWHTLVFVVFLLGLAWAQATPRFAQRQAHLPSRIPLYISTLIFELFLAGWVWLGVWLRRTTLRNLIGGRWAQWKDFWTDVGVAFVFWLVVLAVVGGLSYLLHFNGNAAASFLMPQTVPEMIVWVVVATSAGFCEELIFRGYLQRQCLALTQNIAAAVILQGIIFGAAHAYQGAKAIPVISVYGMLFGALAAMRKSLRPGMLQHATQDSVAGLAAHFLTKLYRLPMIRF